MPTASLMSFHAGYAIELHAENFAPALQVFFLSPFDSRFLLCLKKNATSFT